MENKEGRFNVLPLTGYSRKHNRMSRYGVVSFGTKDLEWVKQYVRNQKEHHACGQIYERLERTEDGSSPTE
ncbi:MAG: hypothetical protein MSG64_07985 [Pyrinomonadaceae bacterium MAG19_C2-C3]|nr:hypothetical protein [Pyrinomonadaceae bacterium MAG19_C2-C3]